MECLFIGTSSKEGDSKKVYSNNYIQLTKNGMGYLMNLSLLSYLIKSWEGVIPGLGKKFEFFFIFPFGHATQHVGS